MSEKTADFGALGDIYAGLGENDIFQRAVVSPQDKLLMRIPAVLGAGHTGVLYQEAVEAALQDGLNAVAAEDLIIHLASYVGLARAFDAMAVLHTVLRARGHAHDIGASRSALASLPLADRFEHGMAQYAQLDGPRAQAQLAYYSDLSAEYYRHVMGMFGCTFGRESFTVREREIATVAVLSAMGNAHRQLAFHSRVALEQGVSREALAEVLLYVQLYAGLPAANNAAAIMLDVVTGSGFAPLPRTS